MVHRDLHCGNWMITHDHKVKLIDFGISGFLGKNGISKEFWVTEQFQAPETRKGQPTGFEGDIFYLGYVFYLLIHP